MVRTNLIHVKETTGYDLTDSSTFNDFNALLLSVIPYEQWTYDSVTEILSVETSDFVEDMSAIGEVVDRWHY